MPGAQPRRGFETRMGSTARRGALVPAGVPGVYRVPRVRTQTVTADTGRGVISTNPWIQPPDVSYELPISATFMQMVGSSLVSGTTPASTFDILLQGNAPATGSPTWRNAPNAGSGTSWSTYPVAGGTLRATAGYLLVKNPEYLAYPTYPDDFPPGATGVEFEGGDLYGYGDGVQVKLPQRIRFSYYINVSAPPIPEQAFWHGGTIYQVPEAMITGTILQRSDVAALDVLATIPALADYTEPDPIVHPLDLTFPAGDGLLIIDDLALAGTSLPSKPDPEPLSQYLEVGSSGKFYIPDATGIDSSNRGNAIVSGTYSPPRYRFIY